MKKIAIRLTEEQRTKLKDALSLTEAPKLIVITSTDKTVNVQGHLADDSVPEAEII